MRASMARASGAAERRPRTPDRLVDYASPNQRSWQDGSLQPEHAPDPPKTRSSSGYSYLLGVVAAAAVLLSLPFVIVGELPGERWLSAADERAPLFAALGALLLAVDVLLPVPSSAVGLMLGARLGLVPGFACCLLGLISGHLGGYGLGRLAPRRWAPAAESVSSAPSMLAVFLSRPVPMLAEVLAIGAGAARMPLGQFIAAVVLGDAVYAAVLSAAGAQLLSTGSYALALVIPMVFIALAGWAARRRGKRRSDADGARPRAE